MKAQEMLSKIKETLGVETQEVELAQAQLENGTIIEAESMASGQEVFIVTEDERVALPVGEYMLEDGQMLKVEEEGIIASIGAAEEAPAEEDLSEVTDEAEELAEEKEEMGYATKEELAEVKSMIEEIKAMIQDKEKMSAEEAPVETEEVKEELSAVEKVKHNPESETKKEMFLYAQKGQGTTLSRVMSKISNN